LSSKDHRRQRLVMQPAFRHEHLRGYVAVMRHEITAVMESWHDGDSVDLVEQMFTLTTTIALRALFSSHLDPARAERLRRAFDTFLRGIYTRAVLPLAGRLPTPGADRGDLMSRLLADGETTSAAVTWSWHLLTTHPEILVAVQAETDAVLGGDVADWDHLPRLHLTVRAVLVPRAFPVHLSARPRRSDESSTRETSQLS